MANVLALPLPVAADASISVGRPGGCERALRSLAGSCLETSLSSWEGRSGRRYVVSVESLDDVVPDDLDGTVAIAVRRDPGGAVAVASRACEPGEPEIARTRWLAAIRSRGASELQLHLLADTPVGRRQVVADLGR